MGHKHSLYDTDPHFTIDPATRRIKNESGKVTLVQGDHNSERFTFEIPRYVDGHDMSLCDVVEVHYDNIDSSTKAKYSDVVEIDDLQVSPASNTVVIFSWLISGNATMYKGTLNFSIGFQCHDAEGNIDYELGTLIHEGITIGERLRNSRTVIERIADVLSKWRNDLFGIGDTEEGRLLDVSKEQKSAIEETGKAVLDSIPDEYTALSAMAENTRRTKANAITKTAEGEVVSISDASDDYLRGLRVFGKSTQLSDPSPDNIQPIHSVENPTLDVTGANLFDFNGITDTTNIERNVDGSLTVTIYSAPTGYTLKDLAPTLKAGKRYTIYIDTDSSNKFIYFLNNKTTWSSGHTVDITDALLNDNIYIYGVNGDAPIVIRNIAIVPEGVPYNGEPYIAPQTATFQVTLRGIPVTSGGNYTDENGQQWICDEIDFERGKYIERVGKLRLTGEEVGWGVYSYQDTYVGFSLNNGLSEEHSRSVGLSNQFSNFKQTTSDCIWIGVGNKTLYVISKEWHNKGLDAWKTHLSEKPLEVIYPRNTPIYHDLTPEELTAFRALHTNHPNTVVLNSAGAWTEVKYNADTKMYVDTKTNSSGESDFPIKVVTIYHDSGDDIIEGSMSPHEVYSYLSSGVPVIYVYSSSVDDREWGFCTYTESSVYAGVHADNWADTWQ